MNDRILVRAFTAFVCSGTALLTSCPAWAGDLIVEVSGVRSNAGEVGCALFSGLEGFPLDTSRAVQVAAGQSTRCHLSVRRIEARKLCRRRVASVLVVEISLTTAV